MNLFEAFVKLTADASDVKKGVGEAKKSISEYRSDVMKLAAQYKKSGMEQSEAMKRAFSEIDKSQYETANKSESESKRFFGNWEGAANKLKSGLGIVAGVGAAALAGAAAGMVALTEKSVEAYGEYEQLVGGAKKIFDEMDYSRIKQDADNAYKDLNMSAGQYIETMNLAGATFAQTMGDEAGYETARKGIKAIADFASGTGKSLDLMNEKYQLITRSSGSYQSIADQFAGILPQTSADFLEQAQAAGFLADSYTKLTEVPVAEYQQAVTEMISKGVADLNLADNTMNESMGTLTGSLAMARAAWENLVVGFADPDADLGQLIDNMVESATASFNNFLPVAGRALEGIGTFFMEAAPALIDRIPETIEMAFPAILAGAASLVVSLVQALPNIALALVNAVMTIADQIGQLIAEKAPGLAEIAQNIVEYFRHAWENVQKIWVVVKPFFEVLWHDIQRVFSVVEAVIGGFFKAAWEAIKLVWNSATGYFQALFDTVAGIFGIIDAVLSGDFSRAWEAIKGVFASWRDFFSSLRDDLLNVFSTIKEAFLNIGRNLVEGLLGGIQERWNKLTGWIGQGIQNLKNMFTGKQGFDEHSPSKWAEGVFSNVAEGGISGWDKTFPELASDLSGDIAGLRSSFALGSLSMQPALAGGVNTMPGMAALSSVAGMTAQPRPPIVIQVQLDKKTIAQATYNEFQDEQTRRGASLINP